MTAITQRVDALDWEAIHGQLNEAGFALTDTLLSTEECQNLRRGFDRETLFRKRVIMEKHNYGRGCYQYYNYPLPALVGDLRQAFYAYLAPVANLWSERLKEPHRYPDTLPEYLAICHDAGQTRPTPLVLRYHAEGFNCLHRDLYGDLAFPLQITILLSEPETEFEGGEFLLVERRPRHQSTGHVAPIRRGAAVIFAVNQRPGRGIRGYHRRYLTHGVSRIRRGERFTLGLIFHDARK